MISIHKESIYKVPDSDLFSFEFRWLNVSLNTILFLNITLIQFVVVIVELHEENYSLLYLQVEFAPNMRLGEAQSTVEGDKIWKQTFDCL